MLKPYWRISISRPTRKADFIVDIMPAAGIPPEKRCLAVSTARVFSAAILFLLREGDYWRLHRIPQDESGIFACVGLCAWLCLGRTGRKPRRGKCCRGRIFLPGSACNTQCPRARGSGQRPAPVPPFPWWAALWRRALASRIRGSGIMKNFLGHF